MRSRIFTKSGIRTHENRDALRAFTIEQYHFFLLIDGNTTCLNGGTFANELADFIQGTLTALPTEALHVRTLKPSIFNILEQAQSGLKRRYPASSASLILLCIHHNLALACYLGDCCLGRLSKPGPRRNITWITPIHCIANAFKQHSVATLKTDPDRNLLTRSFKGKRFELPQYKIIALRKRQTLILASDGFWADLSNAQQLALISSDHLGVDAANIQFDDDTSFILIDKN